MSTDALAALLAEDYVCTEGHHGRLSCPFCRAVILEAFKERGVVVLPPDHPLRTGEPSEAMTEAARRAIESWLETTIWATDDQREALVPALRAALAVLRV